jgi:RNA polymerase sigma factor (sigma-70 family)
MNDFSCLDDNFINTNEYLIRIAIGKYSWLNNYEEIQQEALIWLCEAKLKFNPKKSKWSTYARYYVEHKLWDFLRSSKQKGRDPQTEGFNVVGIDNLIDATLYKNRIENDKLDDVIFYDMALDCLPEGRDKEILILITMRFTYDEIGKRYDLCRERIRQIYNNQIKLLKERMCK